MKRFANLYDALDSTNSTLAKVNALVDYFRSAPPADAAWGLFFLTGRRLKRLLGSRVLYEWTTELTGLPGWLLDESYAAVGDAAETIALLLDSGSRKVADDVALSQWLEDRLLPLRQLDPDAQRERVVQWWKSLPRRELFLINKLLTGELRVGVSQILVVRAIAQLTELPAAAISHRLMGTWEPSAAFFNQLIARDADRADQSRPYPFYLASPLEGSVAELGDPRAWLVEWKWDGIRGQLIRRGGQSYLWSRGEELITDRFPELSEPTAALPNGTVLDGEVLAFDGEKPLPFSVLQRRIGRQQLTPRILAEAPVVFMGYDVLEWEGVDIRGQPLAKRRAVLVNLVAERAARLRISPAIEVASWSELSALQSTARHRAVEGVMLKLLSSAYRTGRKKGDWWKWKIDPFTVDAVLVYAHPGHGRRANLFTDYTFAVWDRDELVPIAKAYSGLSDAEIQQLDRWIRSNTQERFGPVRSVNPMQVFELHFEAIAPSSRHRSGIAVRFPRIARWRTDKSAREADTLQTLRALLGSPPAPL